MQHISTIQLRRGNGNKITDRLTPSLRYGCHNRSKKLLRLRDCDKSCCLFLMKLLAQDEHVLSPSLRAYVRTLLLVYV